MTKAAERRLSKYYDSDYSELYQCYSRPSEAKKRTFDWCKLRIKQLAGKDLRIVSFNTYCFSVSFVYVDYITHKFSLCTITQNHTYYDTIDR